MLRTHEVIFILRDQDKGNAWHIDATSVDCTLIDKGKLANQIVTLRPTVVE